MTVAAGETWTFRVSPEAISAVDTWIEEIGNRWGIDERTAFGARLCVAEIATNVLEHGAGPGEPAEIAVTLRRRGGGLDIDIADSGRPFDPTSKPDTALPETLEEAAIGGLGLRLVRAYASEIAYHHDGVRNHHRLHLPASASRQPSLSTTTS
jgi:anti-sigma regulatory factor (Ser/Thr protein kinase)